jgi:hypothetical protein
MAFSKKRKGGKNRSGSEKRKRGASIGFRGTEDERAKIQAAADRVGLTLSSYVRSQSLSEPTTRAVRRPPVQVAQLAQLLGLLGVVGGDLRRIAQHLGDAETASETEAKAALNEFREAAASIMQLLGKRPHDY